MGDKKLFGGLSVNLRHCLETLAEQAFIRRPAPQDPVEPEPAYLRHAVTYTEGTRPEEDFGQLANVTEKQLADHEGLLYLGTTCLSYLNGPEEAQEYFVRCIRLNRDSLEAKVGKGKALVQQVRNEEAIEAYQEALDPSSDSPEIWVNRSEALMGLERYEEALEDSEKTINLNQNYQEAWGIKMLLQRADEAFLRLSHLWLDAGGYRGEDKGADWVRKTLGWSVDLVERPKKLVPEEVLMRWAREWAKEGVAVDWRKVLLPKGYVVLPRRWVVERTLSWIDQQRRMSRDYERLCASGEALVYAAMIRLMTRRLACV